jgi:molecular chaperone HtpG
MSKETLAFQTEVKQLLHLMIHSLYSNRDIFLRELVSNASDACDKLRVEALQKPELYEGDGGFRIRISVDKDARTITISDNGIGMSREEAVEHLGTIARSGTKEFFGKLTGDDSKDSNLIGQFGVGFYSAFIVADQVTVISRRAGLAASDAVRWESDGSGEFSVQEVEKTGRGTDVILHLRAKEGEGDDEKSHDDLLEHWTIKEILKRYSDHIGIPIEMRKRDWDDKKNEYVEKDEWETVNQASALWTRPKNDISEEQYKSFFQGLSFGTGDPLAWTHNRVEGRTEYTQLLYVPSKAPFDLYDRQQRHGLKLYVKRVFIMDDAEQLLPSYLRFVRGVVDSSDLPLNVSREILQESRDIKAIREGCTKRILGLLEDMAANKPEDYATFWKEFGQCLKEGFGEDFSNKEKLSGLMRFMSTKHEGDAPSVSLKDYVGRMKEGQEKIYVITADSIAAAKASPHLEVFNKKDIEVLLLTDRIDEWMLNFLNEFEGKQIQSVAKGALDLGKLEDKDTKPAKDVEKEYKPIVEKAQKVLGDKVKEVRMTGRLTESACCLVSEEHDMSGHLERLLKQAGQKAPDRKPILELNPEHPLVKALSQDSASFDDLVWVLFDQALLAEGGQPQDPAAFVKRLNSFMLRGLMSG